MNTTRRFLLALAKSFIFVVPLVVSVSAHSAGLNFVSPAANSSHSKTLTVTVNVPKSSNTSAEKVNMIIDGIFYKSLTYNNGKTRYDFPISTKQFTNGWHAVHVRTVGRGKIVSTATRGINFTNQLLEVHTPTANRSLSGTINVTGITRTRASKINVKFGNINDNSQVFSKSLTANNSRAKPFSVSVNTNTVNKTGNTAMHVRAIGGNRDLKTVSRNVNFPAAATSTTAIKIPKNRAYFGVHTTNDLNQTGAENKRVALNEMETLMYQENNSRFSMSRIFYTWPDLLQPNDTLNPFIRKVADEGRIPVISLATIKRDGGPQPITCDMPNLSTWGCIAAGRLDGRINTFIRAIRAETEKPGHAFKMSFTMHHEPLNEIRCNDRTDKNSSHNCQPLNKSIDLGSDVEFVNAWKHMRKLFRRAKNVDFMWTLQGRAFDRANIGPVNGSSYLAPPETIYPGDAYVDWVAADVYNTANCNNGRCEWTSMAAATQPFLDWAAREAPNKPLVLAELGVPADPTRNNTNRRFQWLNAAKAYIKNNKQIKAVLYWNQKEVLDGGQLRDWRLDSNFGDKNNFSNRELSSTIQGAQQFIQDRHFIRAGQSFD